MKTYGNLKKWNDDKGFGFIVILNTSDEIFVHISAFPKDGVRPIIGELISFEIQTDENGKRRAERVMRRGAHNQNLKRKKYASRTNENSLKLGSIAIFIFIIGLIGYKTNHSRQATNVQPQIKRISPTKITNQKFKCDGRQHCSQMHSREEAEYFIKNCPNTKMDGDNDGVPCENDSRF